MSLPDYSNISINTDNISLLDTISFELTTNASSYQAEELISSYINNLFDSFNNVKNYWESTVINVKNYHSTAENVELPEAPETNINSKIPNLSNLSSKKTSYVSNKSNYYSNSIKTKTITSSDINTNKQITLSSGKEIKVLEVSGDNIIIEIDNEKYLIDSKFVDLNNNTIITKANVLINNTSTDNYFTTTPDGGNYYPLTNGLEVEIIEFNTNNDWVKVKYMGQELYVKSENLVVN